MTPKVFVVIEGGIVQAVHANMPIEYVVVDYDKHAEEEVIIYGPTIPDQIFEDGKAHELITEEYPLSEGERKAKDHLIEYNF